MITIQRTNWCAIRKPHQQTSCMRKHIHALSFVTVHQGNNRVSGVHMP